MWSKYMVSLLLITIKTRLLHGQCEKKIFRKDYVYKEDTNNFYKINTLYKTWSEAKKDCMMDRATLFYPEDEKEATSIIAFWNKRQSRLQKMWIGVADWIIKESYQTVDGKNLFEVYDKWAFNEPDKSGDNKGCVVMQGDGTLRVESCTNSYGYFCKKSPKSFQWNSECGLPDVGYKYNKDLQKCYKFHLIPENWTEAYSICKSEDSHLAIVNSQMEYNYLKNITAGADKVSVVGYFVRGSVFLGFHSKNGLWETIDGVPLQDSGFGNLGNYTPSDSGLEACGCMFYGGEFFDVACSNRMFFICEHAIDLRLINAYNKMPGFCTNGAVGSLMHQGRTPLYYTITVTIICGIIYEFGMTKQFNFRLQYFLILFYYVICKVVMLYGQCGNKFYRKDYIYKEDMNIFLKINTASKTWSEAKKNCVVDRATLFYPEDEYEAMAVIAFWNERQPQLQKIWIGIADWNIKELYQTIDGKSLSEVYDKWMLNEPDNFGGNEGCVVMQGDGTLKDESCSNNYGYVCQKTPDSFEWNTECGIPYEGYKYNKDLQRCYKFHLTPENWTDAYSICKSEQSYLAIINSQMEDYYLRNITAEADKDRNIVGGFLRGAVHLGYLNKNGFWETIDGVPVHYSGFGDGWGYQQPDGGDKEPCGSMFYSGQLNDIACWHRMFFICEHEIDPRIVEAYNRTTELLCTKAVSNAVRSFMFRDRTQVYFMVILASYFVSWRRNLAIIVWLTVHATNHYCFATFSRKCRRVLGNYRSITVKMWSKHMIFLLLIQLKYRLIYGQTENNYFRNDYTYKKDMRSFYKINMILKTWKGAQTLCELEGTTLFYPEDEEEAMAVLDLWNETEPQIQKIWVGMSLHNAKTVDGKNITQVYENWAFNEPDNAEGNEGCVVMQQDGTLKDESCINKYRSICKKTVDTVSWNDECHLPYMGYKYNKDLQRCYKFHLTPKTWDDAYTTCRAEQSYLAVINSVLEDEHLVNITAEAPKDNVQGNYLRGAVHLGFHDRNGLWETINGVPLHESGFGWGYSQPDGGGNEKCGSMFYTGQLNDIGCWQRMFFICEHEPTILSANIKDRMAKVF
ncbi:uncharacterized protein [Epargyreus clarus]|uniref:uncharacterized protein n=1 Tax=Epargyreus clarus TaxID=520877 RepID=UPI003C2BB0D8